MAIPCDPRNASQEGSVHRRGRRCPGTQAVELATLVERHRPGGRLAARDQVRRLPNVMPRRQRQGAFISRNGHDWTDKFPELAEAAGAGPRSRRMLDGEVVALKPDGTTSFQALQNVFQTGRTGELVYYVFDILHLNGHDLTGVPLECAERS